jgi:sRNA-binding regulator protein Hfq
MSKAKTKAPLQTLAEDSYLKSLAKSRAAVAIKLLNGKVLEGTLEGFDADILRLATSTAPHLLYKEEIKYLWELPA